MANIKGGRAARKRDRQNEKARKRNAVCKAKLHDAHKKLFKLADAAVKKCAAKALSHEPGKKVYRNDLAAVLVLFPA